MRGSWLLLLGSLGIVACGGSSTSSSSDGESGAGAEGGASGTSSGSSGSSSGGAAGRGGSSGTSSGGTASGGTATGGQSGSDTGGFAGVAGPSGGDGGTATGGSAGLPTGVCRSVEDCRLSEDCCSCFAAGPGEATLVCRSVCDPDSTACARDGTTERDLACVAGRCVLARSCDLRGVTCEIVMPDCPSGTVPSAIGSCYGPCTPISECANVESCAVCESAGLACATTDGFGPSYHCVSTPPECENNPTCECMHVCPDPTYCVDPDGTELSCVCPVC